MVLLLCLLLRLKLENIKMDIFCLGALYPFLQLSPHYTNYNLFYGDIKQIRAVTGALPPISITLIQHCYI